MSGFDAEFLQCRDCEERWAFGPEAFYRSPQLEAQSLRPKVLKDRIWCWHCEMPRYAERIPSVSEFRRVAMVRRMPEPSLPACVEDELLEVDDADFAFLFSSLRSRSQTGHCLQCGSTSYFRLEVAADLVVNLCHPLCGGRLYFHKVFFNGHSINPKRVFRWMAPDGQFLNPDENLAV